jgi:hypothetical protein
MDQGLPERRAPIYFGVVRPELLEDELFLEEDFLAGESSRKQKKRLFGFLAVEDRELPAQPIDPTTLSRANKFGGR